MSTMKIRWQLNICFMVLLITSCFGGPVIPPKKTATTLNNVVSTVEAVKLASDAPKVGDEVPNPVEVETNRASSILNYNIKIRNSTAASNQVVSQAVPGENKTSGVSAAIKPSSAIPPGGITDSDAGAGVQAKTEGDTQPETTVVDDKTVNISNSTVIEKTEAKVNESVTTNEANESNITTKDDTKSSVIAAEVKQEKNTSNSLGSPTLPSVNLNSTVSEDKKGDAIESESGNPKETEPKLSSVDSQSNGSTQNQEQIKNSENNTQPENQDPSLGSDSNTETGNQLPSSNSESNTLSDNQESTADSDKNTLSDNQQPSLIPESNTQTENKDVSLDSNSNIETTNNDPIESDFPVQGSKVETGKSSAATPSSFKINYGDASATYQQNSDPDYSSFDSDNKNAMSSSNDIFEDGLNSEDVRNYDNEGGPYENERGANPQQKLKGSFTDDEDSHFFAYFLTIMVTAIVFYLLFHNKQRIFALIIEGRSPRSRRTSRGTRYHKLDNNFEEAMVQTKGSTRFDGLY